MKPNETLIVFIKDGVWFPAKSLYEMNICLKKKRKIYMYIFFLHNKYFLFFLSGTILLNFLPIRFVIGHKIILDFFQLQMQCTVVVVHCKQGFPCEVFHTGKNLFSSQGTPVLIAGTLYSLQGIPCENYYTVKSL